MYHSITFGTGALDSNGRFVGKNTWDDWHLIPSSRPVIAQSTPSTFYVEIPGRKDGPIDLSEYLTGGIVYGQRTGSIEFYIDNDHENNETIRMKIASFLHGKKMKMCLEDDPNCYYEGRFALSNFNSGATNSKITINYSVGPYKYGILDNEPRLSNLGA